MARNDESTKIEDPVCEHATSLGVRAHKLKGAGNEGMPDRIFTYRGFCLYVEFKTPTGRLRPAQKIVSKHLAEERQPTALIDTKAEGVALLDDWIRDIKRYECERT